MLTINLINRDLSDVKYERSTFPDGENHIKLLGDFNRKTDYTVICRVRNSAELFELMQVADILNRQAVEWYLHIYYLMSMRMDRVISFNEAYSLDVVAKIINSFHAKSVKVFHPHSEKTISLIDRCSQIDSGIGTAPLNYDPDNIVYCYPDNGANERYNLFKEGNYIVLQKVRDLNNKGIILKIDFKYIPESLDENYNGIINVTDDLCDAGGTFIGAANLLRSKFPNAKLHINVRHLVNPNGLKNLSENYDSVVITNSYADWNVDGYDNVEIIDVINGIGYRTL